MAEKKVNVLTVLAVILMIEIVLCFSWLFYKCNQEKEINEIDAESSVYIPDEVDAETYQDMAQSEPDALKKHLLEMRAKEMMVNVEKIKGEIRMERWKWDEKKNMFVPNR